MEQRTDTPVVPYQAGDEPVTGLRVVPLEDLVRLRADLRSRSGGKGLPDGVIDIERPHHIEFATLVIVTSGSGRHDIDFEPYHFAAWSVLWTSFGQVQQFCLDEEVRGYMFMLAEPFVLRHIGRRDTPLVRSFYGDHNAAPHVAVDDPSGLDAALADLLAEFDGPHESSHEQMLWLLLRRLLIVIDRLRVRSVGATEQRPWSPLFLEFKRAVTEGFRSSRSVNHYAAELGLGPSRLNAVVKEAVNMTAKQFLDDTVVLQAKRRLAIDDTPVGLIAVELGFDEATNFSRYFKHRVGQTPAQFRRSLE